MAKVIDMTGQRFGRLTVLQRAGFDKWGNSTWLCLCDCGIKKVLGRPNLMSGNTRSCGCLNKGKVTSHGKSHTRLYRIWSTMAYSSKSKGIEVCEEWRNSFQAFYDWAMAHGFQEDAPKGESFVFRIDKKYGFSPGNCAVGSARQAHEWRKKRVGALDDDLMGFCSHGERE